jgi:hypothetical protein
MTPESTRSDETVSMWRWWPCVIGGLCSPLLALVLARWMPSAVAFGVAVFIMWNIVSVIFSFSPPNSKWSMMRWTAWGLAGAIVAGGLAFLLSA